MTNDSLKRVTQSPVVLSEWTKFRSLRSTVYTLLVAVVPARLPMLWAKLAVCAGAVFLTMLVSSLTAATLGQALLSRKHLNASLSDPAALLRNTVAAISTVAAVFFVIPLLAPLLLASWSGHSCSTCHPTLAR